MRHSIPSPKVEPPTLSPKSEQGVPNTGPPAHADAACGARALGFAWSSSSVLVRLRVPLQIADRSTKSHQSPINLNHLVQNLQLCTSTSTGWKRPALAHFSHSKLTNRKSQPLESRLRVLSSSSSL